LCGQNDINKSFILLIFLMLPIGYLLLGIATYRAGILSRAAALLTLGPVINSLGVMSPMISTIGVLYTVIAWLSYGLLAGTTEKVVAVPETQPAM
jgi:hypothetical protein